MKAIILAAGYGTRLEKELAVLKSTNPEHYKRVRPFIKGKAKPMIVVAGKPVIQYTVENIERAGIDKVYVITNNKYFHQFENWRSRYKRRIPINLFNDGTDRNEERLGAVKDLIFLLDQEDIDEDILVVAGDNLLKFELKELVDFFHTRQTSAIVVYREQDKDKIRKSACVEFNQDAIVTGFEEKPAEPKSDWICPAVYAYTAETVRMIREMHVPEHKKDLIGNIVLMLYNKVPVGAFSTDEKIRFDLGTIADFEAANTYFQQERK